MDKIRQNESILAKADKLQRDFKSAVLGKKILDGTREE